MARISREIVVNTSDAFVRLMLLCTIFISPLACSKKPPERPVTVTFIYSDHSELLAISRAPDEQEKKALQAAIDRLKNGDKVSITISSHGTATCVINYLLEGNNATNVMHVDSSGKKTQLISGSTGQDHIVLALFGGEVLSEIQTMTQFARPNN